MNPAFWILVLLIVFLIWWSARGHFVKIGKTFSDKRDEIVSIIHTNMYDEIIRDGCVSEKTMKEFVEYYEKNLK